MIGKIAFYSITIVCGMIGGAASADTTSRLWVKDLQRSEELVASAIATSDVTELRKQGLMVSKLIGRSYAELSALSDDGKMACLSSAQSLMNFTDSLRKSPAQALISARHDADAYRSSMASCEKANGIKPKRTLPL